jgi:hypothetical protein
VGLSSSGPPEITTVAGTPSARLTSADAGDYVDNAAIMHLSHVIDDLAQFYARPAGGAKGPHPGCSAAVLGRVLRHLPILPVPSPPAQRR